MSFDIAMEIEWLPRSQNDKADYLSRIVDLDDWSMSAALFQLVVSSWGPHTVDRFASFYNTQVPRFSYFGIRSLRSWKLLPKIGPGTTTGFVRLCQ